MKEIGIDSKVSSLRDLMQSGCLHVRRLKPTVNKGLSLRDIALYSLLNAIYYDVENLVPLVRESDIFLPDSKEISEKINLYFGQ
jgi:hypothetical protein